MNIETTTNLIAMLEKLGMKSEQAFNHVMQACSQYIVAQNVLAIVLCIVAFIITVTASVLLGKACNHGKIEADAEFIFPFVTSFFLFGFFSFIVSCCFAEGIASIMYPEAAVYMKMIATLGK